MIRLIAICCLLAAPSFGQWFSRSGTFEADRLTVEAWTNLIRAVNERCDTTSYLADPVPPMTQPFFTHMVSTGHYVATWPVAAGIAYDKVFVTTNAAGVVTAATNYHLPTVPVLFTNFVGWLSEDDLEAYQDVMTNLTWTTLPTHDVVTNFAFTAANLHALDQRIFSLLDLGYFIDQKQVDDVGGLDAWFAEPRDWEWRTTNWVHVAPRSPPMLNRSNAWENAGIPMYFVEQVVTQHVDVPGWMVGNLTAQVVRTTTQPVPVTNRYYEYLFSLAPEITNFVAEMAQVRLVEKSRTVTTNNGIVTTTRTLGWSTAVFPWTEAVVGSHPATPRFDERRIDWRPFVSYVPPGTGSHYSATALDFTLSITGFIHALWYGEDFFDQSGLRYMITNEVLHVDTSAAVPATANPFARVTGFAVSTNWTFVEIERDPEPPGWTNMPSLTGAVVSLSVSGVYARLKRHVSPSVPGASAWDINPFADAIHYHERFGVVSQLTHSAVAVTSRYFSGDQVTRPVLFKHPSPRLDNGIVSVSFGLASRRNYNNFGWQINSADYIFGGTPPFLTFGRISSITYTPGESFYTNDFFARPFVGHNHTFSLYEGDDYYQYHVTSSRTGGDIIFSHERHLSTGHDKINTYQISSSFTPLLGNDPVTTTSSQSARDDEYSSALSAPSIRFPRHVDFAFTNVTTNLAATASLYARFSFSEDAESEVEQTYTTYISANGGSNCVEVTRTAVVTFARSPLASQSNERFYRPVEDLVKPAGSGYLVWPAIDFNGGLFPGQDWFESGLLYSAVACTWGRSEVRTNQFSLAVERSTLSGSDNRDTYFFKTRYRGASRNLDGIWLVFVWQFSDPYH